MESWSVQPLKENLNTCIATGNNPQSWLPSFSYTNEYERIYYKSSEQALE